MALRALQVHRISRARWLFLLLLAVATIVRAPAPWKYDVINDEMHHLESWRNRYGTDDIYPLFLQRLELSGHFSADRLELIRTIYHLHPLIQRGLIVLVDPQPPVYPVLAEVTQWLTDSSLVTLRLWSVLFSLAAVFVAYRLGCAIRDEATGLWVALLTCIGATTQFYAGIGRPYALTQLVILLAMWAYALRAQRKISQRKFLAFCVLAQAVQWMAWAVVGPLVALELLRYRRTGERLKDLWWYVPASALLLGYMLVQLQNPTVSNQGGVRSLWQVWWCYSVAGPFSHLGSFGDVALHCGAAAFAGLVLVGALWAARYQEKSVGLGLVLSAICGLLAALLIGVEVRFAVSYIVPATVLAGVGGRMLWARCASRDYSLVPAGVMLIGLGSLAIWHPENPYERIDQYDIRWSQAAEVLKRELRPGETWTAYPPNLANNVYRYGPLPEPVVLLNAETLHDVQRDRPGILVMREMNQLQRGDEQVIAVLDDRVAICR